jgi:hypothetical protein
MKEIKREKKEEKKQTEKVELLYVLSDEPIIPWVIL